MMTTTSYRQITPELFAFVCFQVLMAHGNGLLDKSPDYILEKMSMVSDGWDAFARLDFNGQNMVLGWLHRWNILIPGDIEKYRGSIPNGAVNPYDPGINF